MHIMDLFLSSLLSSMSQFVSSRMVVTLSTVVTIALQQFLMLSGAGSPTIVFYAMLTIFVPVPIFIILLSVLSTTVTSKVE